MVVIGALGWRSPGASGVNAVAGLPDPRPPSQQWGRVDKVPVEWAWPVSVPRRSRRAVLRVRAPCVVMGPFRILWRTRSRRSSPTIRRPGSRDDLQSLIHLHAARPSVPVTLVSTSSMMRRKFLDNRSPVRRSPAGAELSTVDGTAGEGASRSWTCAPHVGVPRCDSVELLIGGFARTGGTWRVRAKDWR